MKGERILLAHGAGGKLSHDLLRELFLPFFNNDILRVLDDSAIIPTEPSKLAFTTDSYVVKPLSFPGGDIGRLAICGTVNDLAMAGARPLGLSASFILEEGFSIEDLEKVLSSMREAAEEAGVMVVAGDTKVVEHGAAEGLYITTTGIGVVPEGVDIRGSKARSGDWIIINGPIGDHEIAVLIARGDFSLQGETKSDCAPLNGLVEAMLKACPDIHCMRDPTRGGLATVLWEIANASGVGVVIEEEKVLIREEVRVVCDLLGFDPYYLANEGKLIAFVPEEETEGLLRMMKAHRLGKGAVVIGRVTAENPGKVLLRTRIGGHRLLDPLSDEQFPRIC
ncbi:MAG: hydrogenase expression/formation protein HypE [Deltaproteobacteria bacterium]|nr:hydrogenase expression/formation protein HypE [Deltaproteobacteria bacterium]